LGDDFTTSNRVDFTTSKAIISPQFCFEIHCQLWKKGIYKQLGERDHFTTALET